MVNGGVTPTHSISVSTTGDDAMTMSEGHGFGLMTDKMGVDRLYGVPNLKAGDYLWTWHAMDPSGQPEQVSISWKLRVKPDVYQGPGTHEAGPESETDTDTTTAGDQYGDEWGSYISSIVYAGVMLLPTTPRLTFRPTTRAVRFRR